MKRGRPWMRHSLCGCALGLGCYLIGAFVLIFLIASQGYKCWHYFDDDWTEHNHGGDPSNIEPDTGDAAYIGGLVTDILLFLITIGMMIGVALERDGVCLQLTFFFYVPLYVLLSVIWIILMSVFYAEQQDDLGNLVTDDWKDTQWGERFAVFVILWIIIDALLVYGMVLVLSYTRSLYYYRRYRRHRHGFAHHPRHYYHGGFPRTHHTHHRRRGSWDSVSSFSSASSDGYHRHGFNPYPYPLLPALPAPTQVYATQAPVHHQHVQQSAAVVPWQPLQLQQPWQQPWQQPVKQVQIQSQPIYSSQPYTRWGPLPMGQQTQYNHNPYNPFGMFNI